MVPDGSVNLAWSKSPSLDPSNNLLVLNSTTSEGPAKTNLSLAYADPLGILQDADGNQTWPEEFPIISDEFLSVERVQDVAQILPYIHSSRYLHLDYVGMAYTGSMTELLPQPEVKVVDKNGEDYVDKDGKPKYKIYAVSVPVERPSSSRDAAYRLLVFLNMDPEEDELFLTYHKVEIDHLTDQIRDEQLGYREPINAVEYFRYYSEEAEVLDQSSYRKKKYSTQPVDIKDQVIGRTQPSYKGWTIQVPKKAVPDPRNFQIFRWRVACEYSRQIDPQEAQRNDSQRSVLNVGVVTFNADAGHTQTRANYLFSQLNKSGYNVSGLTFQNPLKENDPAYNNVVKDETASYWHVPINDIAAADLDKFDVLVWAPSNPALSLAGATLAKIEYFVKDRGGTFIIETCSRTLATGIDGLTFSPVHPNLTNTGIADGIKVSTTQYYEEQSATPSNSAYGLWDQWPPKMENLWTNQTHSSELLQNLNFLGAWDLNLPTERIPTGYSTLANAADLHGQYINISNTDNWETILDAEFKSSAARLPVLVRRKYPSGGSFYVSTASIFEDHIIQTSTVPDGHSVGLTVNTVNTLQYAKFSEFSTILKNAYNFSINSINMEGEIKLRMNVFTLATAFRTASNGQNTSEIGYNADFERNTTTLYSDWQSSWVINAHDGVLTEEEKAKYNFALLPKKADDPNPVWMRMLAQKTVSDIMAEKIHEIDPENQNALFKSEDALNRRYILIITNPEVETYTYDQISDNTVPAAWTYSYSPRFEVPVGIGAYEVREDVVAATGVGSSKQIFPPRPYKIRATANYVSTTSKAQSVDVRIKLTGKGRRVYKLPDEYIYNPPPPYTAGWYVDKLLRWAPDSGAQVQYTPYTHQAQIATLPIGLETWTDANYSRALGASNWPYWGMRGQVKEGSSGLAVGLVQQMINQAIFFNWIPGPYMPEDSYYSNALGWKVIQFQQRLGALYIDGIVDAETWSLFGYLMLNISGVPGALQKHVAEGTGIGTMMKMAMQYMPLQNASAAGNTKDYTRQTLSVGGPPFIREAFSITFSPQFSDWAVNNNFELYALAVNPFVPHEDKSKSMTIDWLDVGAPHTLRGYNFSTASHGSISVPCVAGKYTVIPFNNQKASRVTFGIRNDGATGYGTTRSLGIADIGVYAKKYVRNSVPPLPGSTTIIPGKTIIEPFNIEVTFNTTLVSGIPKNVGVTNLGNNYWLNGAKITTIDGAYNPADAAYPRQITDITFDGYEIQPSTWNTDIQVQNLNQYVNTNELANSYYSLVYNPTNTAVTGTNYIAGPKIGDGSTDYHIRSTDGAVEPFKRSYGWVTKDQGIILVCDENGKPFGFPPGAPREGKDTETHFTRLTMDSWNTDQMLFYGFYDVNKQEFLTNSLGEPDISYYEYVRRGPENVFMAVQTSYEVDTQSGLPATTDPVVRPFKWAMPVYGVKLRNETSIKLRNPSKELSINDVWPILVSTGSFSKQVSIPYAQAIKATNWVRQYPDSSLTAHYIINEALKGPWSKLLGRPYVDIKDEQPRLLSEDTLVVNHWPIASIQEPTVRRSPSDPYTALFTVYTRTAIGQPWVELEKKDILEYNLNTGTIVLKAALREIDPRLVKVSYTARDYTYQIRNDGKGRINLNPYMIRRDRPEWLDRPLYVYLKPAFVVDNTTKAVIAESKTLNVINISETNTMFSPIAEDYDPTAHPLGIIIVLSKVDIEDLTILDTRVRGGGAKHHLPLSELDAEADSYWDSPTEKPYSYQRGGFVILQLPKEIIQQYPTEEELRVVIDRNITNGVAYEVQDYDGNSLYDNTDYTQVDSTLDYIAELRSHNFAYNKVVPKAELITMGADLTGTGKWTGGVLAPNGKIYCAPSNADDVLVIDTLKGTAERKTMGQSFSGTTLYASAVLAPDGKIYCIPYSATDILIIDPTNDTAITSNMGASLTGASKWGSGVLASDGKIYCSPLSSNDVLVIDPANNTAVRTAFGLTLTGTPKYRSISRGIDNKLYCIPFTATSILVINPANGTAALSTMDASLSGATKWNGNALGADGKIYSIPSTSTNILIIDTTTGTATRSAMGANLTGTGKWTSATTGVDGKIYAAPNDATDILVIDPINQTAIRSNFGISLSGTGKWTGAVLGADGSIYGIPSNATNILKISFENVEPYTYATSIHPAINKY